MTRASASDFGYADTLWKSADALRGQIDAAEYRHVALSLLLVNTSPTKPTLTRSVNLRDYYLPGVLRNRVRIDALQLNKLNQVGVNV